MFDSWHFMKSLNLGGPHKAKAHQAIFNLLKAEDCVEYQNAMSYLEENQEEWEVEDKVMNNIRLKQ